LEHAEQSTRIKMNKQMIFVRRATVSDIKYVNEIIKETEESAVARGTGISKRTPESVAQKMRDNKAVIALTSTGQWVGFAYFECYEQEHFISNSGLIVSPKFRNTGVAKSIKDRIFRIARRMYPDAKIFSITSGTAVMKMNTQLGFQPVAFSEITHDEQFWEGCKSCPNYDILERKHKCNCLCTAMLFDPAICTEHSILPGHELEQRYAVQKVNSI
jgi:N-acetylglutamate synthase-like GNAT family acetyltransferase